MKWKKNYDDDEERKKSLTEMRINKVVFHRWIFSRKIAESIRRNTLRKHMSE